MEVVYSEALIAYMKKKGYSFISVESISPKGCCADSTELLVAFVSDKAAEQYKAKGCRIIKAPQGELLILSRGLEYGEKVSLGLRSFLGLKDITVDGIAAWKL